MDQNNIFIKIYTKYCEIKQKYCLQCCESGFTSESLKHHTCSIFPNYYFDPEYYYAAIELVKEKQITEEEYLEWHKLWSSMK